MSDTRDRSDAIVVTYGPLERAPRREVFEPHDGPDAKWHRRFEARRDDGTWRPVGGELVDRVTVEGPIDG